MDEKFRLLQPETERRIALVQQGFFETYYTGETLVKAIKTHMDLQAAITWAGWYETTSPYHYIVRDSILIPLFKELYQRLIAKDRKDGEVEV